MQVGVSAHPRPPGGSSEGALLCTVCVTVAGPLAGLQRGPSLLLSGWVGAHQISWLSFIALSLIGIILGEEIAVSHPRLTHSQRDRSHPHGGGVTNRAGRLALSGKAGNPRSWQGRGKRGLIRGGGRKYLEPSHPQAGTVSPAINPERAPPSSHTSHLLGKDLTLPSARLCPKQREKRLQRGC